MTAAAMLQPANLWGEGGSPQVNRRPRSEAERAGGQQFCCWSSTAMHSDPANAARWTRCPLMLITQAMRLTCRTGSMASGVCGRSAAAHKNTNTARHSAIEDPQLNSLASNQLRGNATCYYNLSDHPGTKFKRPRDCRSVQDVEVF